MSFDPPIIFSLLCLVIDLFEGIKYRFSETFIISLSSLFSNKSVVFRASLEFLSKFRYVDTFP